VIYLELSKKHCEKRLLFIKSLYLCIHISPTTPFYSWLSLKILTEKFVGIFLFILKKVLSLSQQILIFMNTSKKASKDALGERIKTNYENRTRFSLPRRSYTIIRIDGKAFHTYTKGLERPFDQGLIEDMNETAAYLCKNIMGAKLAYVQSDEISIVITDFEDISTQAWFDNNLQKMCSVAASMATAKFNQLRMLRSTWEGYDIEAMLDFDDIQNFKLAMFDARVFQIPQKFEVLNYLIYRMNDAVRNSIASVAQSLYSPKELNGKNSNEQQEMVFQKGINWNDYDFRKKRGGVITKVQVEITQGDVTFPRTKWKLVETPIFTQNREFLENLIPNNF
jgi:tRNA(His) guanylyltransferase